MNLIIPYFSDFYQTIAKSTLSHWLQTVPTQINHWQKDVMLHKKGKHSFIKLCHIVKNLPLLKPTQLNLLQGVIAERQIPLSTVQNILITALLKKLIPWRKGPFSIYGINIDSEWRSDWKWERIKQHITPLEGRMILDVGCGNGYYLWRMVGSGAKLAVGIDPCHLFYFQFLAVRKLLGMHLPAYIIPLCLDNIPNKAAFDTIFSMGVLYHCRSPLDHLLSLKKLLVCGGELILETMIIEGNEQQIIMPRTRYANMRNVYFLPSSAALTLWLERCGFVNIRQVDITATSLEEQRRTSWSTGYSLEDALKDENITIEGYPAPLRTIFIAIKPLSR